MGEPTPFKARPKHPDLKLPPMDVNRVRTRAEWEITVGQLTVAATLAARLITVVVQLRAASSLNPVLFGQAVLKSGILVLVLVSYRRYAWPSLLMLVVWPIGFLYAWLGPAHATPPVVGIGLLVGLSLFIGALGMHSLRRVRAMGISPAVAAQR